MDFVEWKEEVIRRIDKAQSLPHLIASLEMVKFESLLNMMSGTRFMESIKGKLKQEGKIP